MRMTRAITQAKCYIELELGFDFERIEQVDFAHLGKKIIKIEMTNRQFDLFAEELTLKEEPAVPKERTWDCKSCYHFDHKDGTCDMCAYGGYMAIDNNGNKPEEVDDCNTYVKYKGGLKV